MTCDRYESFALGRISAETFAVHSESCRQCREAHTLDSLFEDECRQLPVPDTSPGLWPRIAAELEQERESFLSRLRGRLFDSGFQPIHALSALAAVTVTLIVLLHSVPGGKGPEPDKLLTIQALARVETLEQQYEQAITEMEQLAVPLITEAETKRLLNYRRRLESLDGQIDRCRSALAGDSANAHKRRYLLAAFHAKKETLTELLLHHERLAAAGIKKGNES